MNEVRVDVHQDSLSNNELTNCQGLHEALLRTKKRESGDIQLVKMSKDGFPFSSWESEFP
jgi:hypothetical protein